jgi:hypothetical protein
VGEAGALLLQAVREWLHSRTGNPLADYRSASRMLARLRRYSRQPSPGDGPSHEQNRLWIHGELALDSDTGEFYLKTSNDYSRLLTAVIELGNRRQRNGKPYLDLVQPCEYEKCPRQQWFFAKRTDQAYCSRQCRTAHYRSTPEGREKRKLYMRDYRELLKTHSNLKQGKNKKRRQS